MLDARERALTERPLSASPIAASDGGFDWADFSVGAGTGIGIVLVLLGVGTGVGVLRRDHEGATTA